MGHPRNRAPITLQIGARKTNLVPRAHVPFGQHLPCLRADQKARGLWERDWRKTNRDREFCYRYDLVQKSLAEALNRFEKPEELR